MIVSGEQKYGEGWRPDLAADAVKAEAAANPMMAYASFLSPIRDVPDKVELWRFMQAVYGDNWFLNQRECGSCVAHTGALWCDLYMAREIIEGRRLKPSGRTDPMTIYWGSRIEIGGGQIRGEGSVNLWMARYLQKFGALEQRRYEALDLTKYDPSVCCGPNASRGVPDALEPIAKRYPVKRYAQVSNFDEAVAAIADGYAVPIASDQGFKMTLTKTGFGVPSGTWNHSQLAVGYELKPTPCLHVANHWGPCYAGGPADWPKGMMKVDKDTSNYMLGQEDSWVLSDHESFAPKPVLDWSVLNF